MVNTGAGKPASDWRRITCAKRVQHPGREFPVPLRRDRRDRAEQKVHRVRRGQDARCGDFVHPLEAITPAKRARIVKTAQFYLLAHPTKLQPRFDAAAVFMRGDGAAQIEYIENAFQA